MRVVERMQQQAEVVDEMSIPRAQHRPPAPAIGLLAARYAHRDVAIVAAYATGACSYRDIAQYFGLHLVTVGRIVRASLSTDGSHGS